MTDAVLDTLKKDMVAQGSEFATKEDAAKAVLRIALDASINGKPWVLDMQTAADCHEGRSLFIAPHSISQDGYLDLDLDDFAEGSMMSRLQKICSSFNHRKLPAELQKTRALM